jgi:hypothetical protein
MKRNGSTTSRGYGDSHQQRRKRLAPLVAAGLAICVRCRQAIEPGIAWALDHRDDRRGYLGPAHARCNAQAGAAKTNAARAETMRWSRRWYDEPPLGTEVFLGDGLVEIHVGRGICGRPSLASSNSAVHRHDRSC